MRAAGRRRTTLGALAAIVTLAGCGEQSDNDVEGARAAAEAYVEALQRADPDAACEVLSAGAAAELEDRFDAACPDALGERIEALGDGDGALGELEVGEVNVAGDVATAAIVGSEGETTAELVREDGDWKLASPAR